MRGAEQPESRAWWLLPALAAIAFLALALHAASVETPTVDEFAHVPAGVAAWRHGRTDLYRSNPPLPKLALAAPLALDPDVVAPEVVEPPMQWGPWIHAHRFLHANRDAYLDLAFRPRLVAIAFALVAAGVVFAWGRAVFGLRAAAIVTALFLLCPNVLAHGHLATIDMAALATIVLAMYALRWAYRSPGAVRLGLAGAALGLALATKFLGVLLLPAVALLAVAHRRRLGRAALDVALLVAVALAVVNASVAFQGSFTPLGEFALGSQFAAGLQSALPAWLPVPLPREYLLGFDAAKEISEHGEFGSYLRGRWSEHGWWYYNAVALGVKLPLAILLLLALSIPAWWQALRFRRSEPKASGPSGAAGAHQVCRSEPKASGPFTRTRTDFLSLSVPLLALVVIFSTASNLNIGIRHVLPALPFLFLLLGPIFQTSADPRRNRASAGLAAVAIGAGVWNVATLHPDHLTFFNALAGGPERGREWLLDSNLDWGQDLYRVKAAADAIDPDAPLYLLYFGHVDPALYGLSYQLVPSTPVEGLVAVSENFLGGYDYLTVAPDGSVVGVDGDTAAWLRDRTPVRRLGSIALYDTRPAGAAGTDVAP